MWFYSYALFIIKMININIYIILNISIYLFLINYNKLIIRNFILKLKDSKVFIIFIRNLILNFLAKYLILIN